jgi:hypothetical protein
VVLRDGGYWTVDPSLALCDDLLKIPTSKLLAAQFLTYSYV